MAVTKASFTATGTWTPAQLATIFESAFIGSGLMTAWHDSFLSGSVENRILAVTYDDSATYGTTYYWFMFSTAGAYLHMATGWDASGHVPTGTQYLDYYATTTNSVSNHWRFFSGSSATTATITRYTSQEDELFTWYLINDGSASRAFSITPAEMRLQSWMDLDAGIYNGFSHVSCSTGSTERWGAVQFLRGPGLRRDLIIGSALAGSTTLANYSTNSIAVPLISYGSVGNGSNSWASNIGTGFSTTWGTGTVTQRFAGSFLLPVGFNGTNPAFTADSNPVFYGPSVDPYITRPAPSDFGLTFHYATNSFALQDTMIVTASVEEWEVLGFSANTTAVTGASPLFLARTT